MCFINVSEIKSVFSVFYSRHQNKIVLHSQKKRYKSCHWGCTFSKRKLLSILGANMYILAANIYILGANMYISGANMYILAANIYILGANM